MSIKEKIKIGLVQADVRFGTADGNLAYLEEMIGSENESADIYLLPELFSTGYAPAFTTKPEAMGLQATRWMIQMAQRKQAAICGSVAIAEKGKVFNRLLFVTPDGAIQKYDKINVFAFSGEDKLFSAGESLEIFHYLGWKIKPLVCFDLRFPETARNRAPYYDLIVCSAHWPKTRIEAWDKLLQARAIENQSFFAAVNRIGSEGEVVYPGHSCLADYLGRPMESPMESEGIRVIEIAKSEQEKFRTAFPFLKPQP